jgi:hypothetical protein
MKTQHTPRRLRPQARSFIDCLREFLTPALWKQAHAQRRGKRHASRWRTQPLLLVLLLMTWCCGDSQAERFETAKAFCVALLPKRRRPGQTVQGFQKALAKLPTRVLRAVAAGVRKVLAARLACRWFDGGFIPIGCDGSRVECPRTAELERHLGQANKARAAPVLWVTALVHLRLGLPWAWRVGKGTASERSHLLQLLPLLPAAALLVADAGAGPTLYVGPASTYYEVVERGAPPVRLTDQEWRARLAAGEAPAPPAWTASFRVAAAAPQELAPD